MSKYKYEFKTADGRRCCAGDFAENLCATCRAKVAATTRTAAAIRTSEENEPPDGYNLAGRQRPTLYTPGTDIPDPYSTALGVQLPTALPVDPWTEPVQFDPVPDSYAQALKEVKE